MDGDKYKPNESNYARGTMDGDKHKPNESNYTRGTMDGDKEDSNNSSVDHQPRGLWTILSELPRHFHILQVATFTKTRSMHNIHRHCLSYQTLTSIAL